MNYYHIVCTDQEPQSEPLSHAHIVAAGVDTDNDGYADKRHTLKQVIDNIDGKATRYFTIGNYSKERAYVEVVPCSVCHRRIIKTYPDDTRDNNLDKIRRCHWQ